MTSTPPTIGDVAAAAGVSVATVSRALRGFDNVSEATRAKVEAAAKALDYRVDSRASSLASGRTSTVGIVAPLFDSWYASQIVASLNETLAAAGYELLVYSVDLHAPNRLHELKSRFRGHRIDGLVLIDLWMSAEEVDELSTFRVPVVTIGDQTDVASSVSNDDVAGGTAIAEHLIGLGHERFLFIGGARPGGAEAPPARLREDALRAAACAAGLPNDAVRSIDGEFTMDGGRRAFAEIADAGDLPSAVVCASDEMAIGVVAESWRRGWSIPDNLSVTGFDGHELAPLFGLTTADQSVRTKGTRAAELLLDLMRSDTNDVVAVRVSTPVELAVRTSTGPPRQ